MSARALDRAVPTRALRFTFTEVLERGRELQIQELQLFSADRDRPPIAIASIANPGGESPPRQGVRKLIDGDVVSRHSKFLDAAMARRGVSVIEIGFDSPQLVVAYQLWTANDNPGPARAPQRTHAPCSKLPLRVLLTKNHSSCVLCEASRAMYSVMLRTCVYDANEACASACYIHRNVMCMCTSHHRPRSDLVDRRDGGISCQRRLLRYRSLFERSCEQPYKQASERRRAAGAGRTHLGARPCGAAHRASDGAPCVLRPHATTECNRRVCRVIIGIIGLRALQLARRQPTWHCHRCPYSHLVAAGACCGEIQ